jgi:hypothetical protein
MSKQVINVGTILNDGTGDALRTGAQKINDNFTEIYNVLGGTNGAPLNIVSNVTAGEGIVVSSGYGQVLVSAKPASALESGTVKIGTGLVITDGVLSAPVYSLPKAASNILGGIKVGNRLSITADGTLSADPGAYTLPTASAQTLGGVRVGAGLTISNGILSTSTQYVLPVATSDLLGGVKIGARLTMTDGILSADIQTIAIVDRLTASDQTMVLDTTGRISYPGNGVHHQSTLVTALPSVDTLVYTTNGNYVRAIKIFALIEKFTNGYESQACEVIAVVNEALTDIAVSVYGVTYTGASPIATFDGQYNLAESTYEITIRPTSTIDTLSVRVQSTELNGTGAP